jgi:hypothetical protein
MTLLTDAIFETPLDDPQLCIVSKCRGNRLKYVRYYAAGLGSNATFYMTFGTGGQLVCSIRSDTEDDAEVPGFEETQVNIFTSHSA